MQRVKDVDSFLRELERPLPPAPGQPKVITQSDLEADAASFMAFAKAFGVNPPKNPGAVPSRPAS